VVKDTREIKKEFPIFRNQPDLVYLDNAATTQKPLQVIDSIVNYYSNLNSNVHRGLYPLAEKASQEYEKARKEIAEFINAEPEEIIFTSGATESLNTIANSIGSLINHDHLKILLTELEHHSNLVPWQQISKSIEYLPITQNFQINYNHKFSRNDFDVLAYTLVSNVTGTIVDSKQLRDNFQAKYLVCDASQAPGNMKIDVKEMNVDFLAFSGHKIYGPMGIGVLYGKKELLQKMNPYKTGGGMIREVKRDSSTWADLPEKFEGGTPNVEGAIGLAEAIKFIKSIGYEQIQKHNLELRNFALEKLNTLAGIKIYHPNIGQIAAPVISFSIEGIHPHDIADFLGKQNICVRAGHHCTQILHRETFQIPASVRVSLGVYNDENDVDKLASSLQECLITYKN